MRLPHFCDYVREESAVVFVGDPRETRCCTATRRRQPRTDLKFLIRRFFSAPDGTPRRPKT
jgi:hypothetical protein